MPKLKTALRILREVARDPKRLNRLIDPNPISRSSPKPPMAEFFNRPPGLPQIDLLDLLPGLDEIVAPYSYLEGQALPTDIALLKGLAKQRPNCRYLEIGSWRGESVANLAKVCHECVAVTLSASEMRLLGYPESAVASEGFFSRGLPNVRFIKQNSKTLDFGQFGKYFDLVFIDGDHSVEGVANDTRAALSVLRNESSVVVWHDYGFTPECVNWQTLEGIRQGLPPDKLNAVFHVSNTICAVLLENSNLPAKTQVFPQMPNKTFTIRLSAQKT